MSSVGFRMPNEDTQVAGRTTLRITEEELAGRQLDPEHQEAALSALRKDGFVVLEDVVALEHVDLLQEKLLEDLQALMGRADAPYNFNRGNIQQDPPPFPPYLFRDVLLNDLVVCVTKGLLGRGVKNAFYSGNTALPSTERQPVHADLGQLWKGLETAHPAYGLVVNVPLVDMEERNGSTELWPGSHLDCAVSIEDNLKVPEAALARRRESGPPVQPRVRRGSILIRDIRLWHAGMPNRTDQPRPMLAMIHYARWWNTGEPLLFPRDTEPFFQDSELRTCARFVDGPIDYIHAPQAYEYPG